MQKTETARDFLAQAAWYPGFTRPAPACVRETPGAPRQWTERHLQAVWYDPELRPAILKTHTGETVRVEHPGHWNLVEGPDFLNAKLLTGPGRRRVAGDVEVHARPADWLRHGHKDDARYRNVVAHVTYYNGVLDRQQLPPGAVQIALRDGLAAQPGFSFEGIDVTAYPYAVRGEDVPCRRIFASLDADAVEHVLRSAGAARLRRKSERMAKSISEQDPEQALYEEWMAALGYRRNSFAFRRLAHAAPLDVLRREAGGDAMRGYAFLMGIAGLLPQRLGEEWDAPARRFFRQAWDSWWKQRERWRERIMPPEAWRLNGLRPVNHPMRRLMAAAVVFTAPEPPGGRLPPPPPGAEKKWVRERLHELMVMDNMNFWRQRRHPAARPQSGGIRLVGRGRAAAILVNVILPWMTAMGRLDSAHRGLLNVLPAEDASGTVRRAAHLFLGTAADGVRYRAALCRQGALQIYADYCLPLRGGCSACRLPRIIADAATVQ